MSDIRQLNGIDIKKKMKEFVINNFLLASDCKTLDDEDSLLQKGIIDSTGVLELVAFIEQTFKFRVEDEELMPDNLDSLNKLCVYINSKLPACPAGRQTHNS
ncbi:MAG: acyl carrier protein [Candidatus Omnitrophica bacterium]|nr:acyl carrier protein [Candidatus Omnitrophota bacterium]